MPNPIRNTARETMDNPLLALAIAMGGQSPTAFIEEQEANGQTELVHSDQIPTKLQGRDVTEADLEAIGFKLGTPTPGDPLFRSATLPPGWSKQRTDHSMWSKIVDNKGRERFSVFYKGAFYDRDAFMRPMARFSFDTYADGTGPGMRAAVITDRGQVIASLGEHERNDYKASDAAAERCTAWLDERYPDWRNPLAYWD